MSSFATVLLSLCSGFLGALTSSLLYLRYEGKKLRRDAARRLIANRHDTTGDEFTRALNELYVVFSDHDEVIAALREFHDVVVSRQEALISERLISLFKSVMAASDIDTSKVGDAFFATPFNVRTQQQTPATQLGNRRK